MTSKGRLCGSTGSPCGGFHILVSARLRLWFSIQLLLSVAGLSAQGVVLDTCLQSRIVVPNWCYDQGGCLVHFLKVMDLFTPGPEAWSESPGLSVGRADNDLI